MKITQDYLRKNFDYSDGKLTWKNSGKVAGFVHVKGYSSMKIGKTSHVLHRIIWIYHNGPTTSPIHHIDGNKQNNKIENLKVGKLTNSGVHLLGLDARERKKEKDARWRADNPDKVSIRQKRWKRNNYEKVISDCAKRRAVKIMATPPWFDDSHAIQVEELFEISRAFRLYTGCDYHVDHIVPLVSKVVCGLHVPWNLRVIPAKENMSKGNIFHN